MVALGRSIIADPEYPNKAKSGKCLPYPALCGLLSGGVFTPCLPRKPGSCVVNPDVGREFKLAEEKAPEKKPKNSCGPGLGLPGLAARKNVCPKRASGENSRKKVQARAGFWPWRPQHPVGGSWAIFYAFLRTRLSVLVWPWITIPRWPPKFWPSFDPDHVILATGSMPDMPVIKGLFKKQDEAYHQCGCIH